MAPPSRRASARCATSATPSASGASRLSDDMGTAAHASVLEHAARGVLPCSRTLPHKAALFAPRMTCQKLLLQACAVDDDAAAAAAVEALPAPDAPPLRGQVPPLSSAHLPYCRMQHLCTLRLDRGFGRCCECSLCASRGF